MTPEEQLAAALAYEKSTDPNSPFAENGFRATAYDVVEGMDLSGKTFIVTGGTSGLGVHTSTALAKAGANVIIAARRPEASAKLVAEIKEAAGHENASYVTLDLFSLKSVRACAKGLLEKGTPINGIICNAGIMACPLTRSAQGAESQFATNHLGHFLFVNLLVPLLKAAAPARVVVVSSLAHQRASVHWEDVEFRESYEKWTAYAQSKSANMLYALEANRRLASQGVEFFSLHPGGIMTKLQRDLDKEEMRALGWFKPGTDETLDIFKTPAGGAATSVFAATNEYLAGKGGSYLMNCGVGNVARKGALDAEEAGRLWTLSEDIVGEEFSF